MELVLRELELDPNNIYPLGTLDRPVPPLGTYTNVEVNTEAG